MNRLIEADVNEIIAQYYYRPDGLRIIKWVAGVFTYHIWNGGNISAELDSNGAVTAKYIYGNQRIAGESNNVRKYYLYNAHGDVVQLTDDMGAVLWYYDYDAFGNEKNPDPNDTNAFRYCGEYYDTETGTIYLRARYYDPRIGRFTQQDPISDGLNWYTYANNNPVMYIDPSGLAAWFLVPVVIGLVAALTGCSSNDTQNSYFTFNANPTYDTSDWNTQTYQSYTNCYSYAFNMLVNPLTGEKFPTGGMQPGMLSGQYNIKTQKDFDNYFTAYLAGTTKSNAALVNLIVADMASVGLSFVPYEAGMAGGYKVALVVSPGKDYHWYRQDIDDTWSHKQGQLPITQDIGYYTDKNGNLQYNNKTLTDPQKDAASIGYTVFVGYYYVKPNR